VTALERRILAALATDRRVAVALFNRRIVQREQDTVPGITDKTKD
jgi:hypothetical protein